MKKNLTHATFLTIWRIPTTILIFGIVSGDELVQLRDTFSIEIISFCISREKSLILVSRICFHVFSPESVE